jgi:hypothetical protein
MSANDVSDDEKDERRVGRTTTTLEQLLHNLLPAVREELVGLINDGKPDVMLAQASQE